MGRFLLYLMMVALTMGCVGESKPTTVAGDAKSNCMGFVLGGPLEIDTIPPSGGGWARPHPGPFKWGGIERSKGEFNFVDADRWVHMAQDKNVATLGTIWPYAEWDQRSCRSEDDCRIIGADQFCSDNRFSYAGGSIDNWRCAPCDYDAYSDFVSKLVERYDGDGIDDMPDLKLPITYWEILNEPEMQEVHLTFFKGDAEDYLEILKAGYAAVKDACPECMVVQAGAAGSDDTLEFWGQVFDLGGAEYFDIASIHCINYGDIDTLNVKDFKALMDEKDINKPIWVTEVEFVPGDDIIGSVEGAVDAGASKVFFTRFVVGEYGPPVPGKYSKEYERVPEMCP